MFFEVPKLIELLLFNFIEVLFISFLAILLTFISTIYPAIKSSRIDPIKVIRNE